VAKVYAPIDSGPRTLVILHKWMKTTGAEMNEARLRMRRIPKDAELVNKMSGASGFWIGDIIVMAGVPSIMRAMLYEVAPKPKIGVRMISRRCARMRARVISECSSARSSRPILRWRSAAIRSSIPIPMSCCARNAEKLASQTCG